MNVLTDGLDDPLKPLGVAAGVFLVLAAAGTLIGAPWTTQIALGGAVVQILSAVLMAVLGAGLVYISWTDE